MISLPDVWRERYLNKLKEWESENRQTSDLFAQNLKKEISAIKAKLERLTDAYLAEALELAEFQQTKNALMAEKKTKEEKLSDFERKGNHWLELTRNWILEANQAKNLALQDNFSEMKNYLKKSARTAALRRDGWKLISKNPLIFSQNCPPKRGAKPRARRLINFGGPEENRTPAPAMRMRCNATLLQALLSYLLYKKIYFLPILDF